LTAVLFTNVILCGTFAASQELQWVSVSSIAATAVPNTNSQSS
jgi:hypothetical protein